MKKFCQTFLALVCMALLQPALQAEDVTAYINPFIGTGSVDASSLKGGTFPGATCPFGLVQLSPDVTAVSLSTMGAGYDYNSKRIYGFSHTHLSGTGIADLQDVQFMPSTRNLEELVRARDYSSAFDHSREQARAGYYSVDLLDNRVRAELTATTRTGMHRYTYPAGAPCNLVIDLTLAPTYRHKNERELYDAQLRVVGPRTVRGYRIVGGWARLRKVYFYAEFNRPIRQQILVTNKYIVNRGMFEADTLWGANRVNGNEVKGFLQFELSAEPLVARVGISAVSYEGARRNLEAENSSFDFDAVSLAARRQWEQALANIRIDGTERQKRIFYTALYHAYVQPNTFSDVDGRYFSPDYTAASVPAGATQYTTFSLWDTYRAAHPLYTLLQPARVTDMVGSMLRFYDAYGFLPIWQLWGSENYCMIGNHAIPVLVDAALKGLPGVDPERVYEAVRTTSTNEHYNADYHWLDSCGYFPVDRQSQAVSISLETAFDDACVARLARALGKTEDAAYFDPAAPTCIAIFTTRNRVSFAAG